MNRTLAAAMRRLGVRALARRLRVSETTVYRWAREGVPKARRVAIARLAPKKQAKKKGKPSRQRRKVKRPVPKKKPVRKPLKPPKSRKFSVVRETAERWFREGVPPSSFERAIAELAPPPTTERRWRARGIPAERLAALIKPKRRKRPKPKRKPKPKPKPPPEIEELEEPEEEEPEEEEPEEEEPEEEPEEDIEAIRAVAEDRLQRIVEEAESGERTIGDDTAALIRGFVLLGDAGAHGRDRDDWRFLQALVSRGDRRWRRFQREMTRIGFTLTEIRNTWFSPEM